jgi:hypothetical protein
MNSSSKTVDTIMDTSDLDDYNWYISYDGSEYSFMYLGYFVKKHSFGQEIYYEFQMATLSKEQLDNMFVTNDDNIDYIIDVDEDINNLSQINRTKIQKKLDRLQMENDRKQIESRQIQLERNEFKQQEENNKKEFEEEMKKEILEHVTNDFKSEQTMQDASQAYDNGAFDNLKPQYRKKGWVHQPYTVKPAKAIALKKNTLKYNEDKKDRQREELAKKRGINTSSEPQAAPAPTQGFDVFGSLANATMGYLGKATSNLADIGRNATVRGLGLPVPLTGPEYTRRAQPIYTPPVVPSSNDFEAVNKMFNELKLRRSEQSNFYNDPNYHGTTDYRFKSDDELMGEARKIVGEREMSIDGGKTKSKRKQRISQKQKKSRKQRRSRKQKKSRKQRR